MNKKGFTLIEVVLAIVVITIAVSATLVVLSKMMGYTANRGQAVDISNAITVSQIAIDRVRDQWFPPTSQIGNLSEVTNADTIISGIHYTYTTEIRASDNTNPAAEYPDATYGDSMLSYRNLLKVTVMVSKNGKQILKTVTYKTRNGYY
ncbi:MAG: type II secretion system protein [Candidatus Contubernalis sp.]|nr:type II secretion system protein [Candidatus Contubernalis sp.]